MEILSTGEKIKRIRVYNGITLKELCGTEISISKMSCIENGKIDADKEVLMYIADKLNIDFEYLEKSVYDQIEGNIKEVEENLNRYDYEKELKFNLEYAIGYEYIDQAMKIVNKLFKYYKRNKMWNKVSDMIPVYYDLYSNTDKFENQVLYLCDLATYLYLNAEYEEAAIYFARIIRSIKARGEEKSEIYPKACSELSKCYFKLDRYEEATEILEEGMKYIEYVETEAILGAIYHVNAIKNILLKEYSKDNKDLAYKYVNNEIFTIIDMKTDYVKCYFRIFNLRDAKNAIEEILQIIPNEPTERCAEELVKFLKILKQYNQKEYISQIINKALDMGIVTNKTTLIEYSYYLKAILLEGEGKYEEAEMNFNLALDALAKFGTKRDFYDRYLDLASLYHKLDNIKESVRYFGLAMEIKKKCNY